MRILLVDDDMIDRQIVRRALGGGMEVLEHSNADDGLKAAVTGTFECALVDYHLPGHDGLWFIEQLRAAQMQLPVIVLTGQGDENTAVQLMKAGAADYLVKGAFAGDTLLHRIRQAVRVAAIEAKQRESDRLLNQIVNNLPGLIAFVDHDLRYKWVSASFETWFGLRRAELVGQSVKVATGEAKFSELQPLMAAALAGQSVRHEHEVQTKQGLKQIVSSYLPQPDGFIAVIEDISERASQAVFEKQLLGIVSHDLRNPVGSMMLAAELLMKRITGDEAVIAKRVVNGGQRATKLIADLLDFSQARTAGIPITRADVDLHALIQSIVDERPSPRVKVKATGCGTGKWDPHRLAQVISNLLTNALAYSPEDSTVEIGCEDDGDGVALYVANGGSPIDSALLPRLFEPLTRGTSAGRESKSIGLGLYIVKSIVSAHGGEISVSSTATGTRFQVKLPRG